MLSRRVRWPSAAVSRPRRRSGRPPIPPHLSKRALAVRRPASANRRAGASAANVAAAAKCSTATMTALPRRRPSLASPVRHRRRAKSRRASSLRSSRTPSRRRSGRAAVTICRCLPRSTSAPTIAGCWSRCRPAGPVPGHRRLLAHRAAGRGAVGERPARRAGDGPRGRGAEGLRRQARATATCGAPG